jgi:DNA repair exonuclease SbcCD ATPase subunit
MSQEKYVEQYLDILTKTMQDSIIKNISLQANLKVTEGIIKELQDGSSSSIQSLQKKIDELNVTVANSQKELNSLRDNKISAENSRLQHLQTTVDDLRKKLVDHEIVKKEYEEVKHQVQHIETFKNELNKTRDKLQSIDDVHKIEIEKIKSDYENTIRELNDQIIYLKLTPAKRKKIDDAKAAQEVSSAQEEPVITDEVIKDGGSF